MRKTRKILVKKEEKKLNISAEGLKGTLDLSDFRKLEVLNCSYNELTGLNISGCSELMILHCNDNYLEEIKGLDSYSEEMIHLSLENNNLKVQDLSVFSEFVDLKFLSIGNNKEEKIKKKDKAKKNNEIIISKIIDEYSRVKSNKTTFLLLINVRITKIEIYIYKELKDKLKGKFSAGEFVDNLMIIRTNFDDFKEPDKRKKDIKVLKEIEGKWSILKEIFKETNFISKCEKERKIIHVNNPRLNEKDEENKEEMSERKRNKKRINTLLLESLNGILERDLQNQEEVNTGA